jgi:hypothetical protein
MNSDRDEMALCIVGAFARAVLLILSAYTWARNGVLIKKSHPVNPSTAAALSYFPISYIRR